ncbi:hypothetical protein PG997_002650 [Apiospora hydei]|uniref:Uncharacterized protein n=1 Tax=Apiospora hydei TaxID=1337664 RepID=A0ABR1WWZ7_9PEZI
MLLPALGALLQTPTYGIVKWFLTSRTENEIRAWALQHNVAEIEAPVDFIKADIKTFLHDKCTSVELQHIIGDVVDKSEGNFLWATIMLRALNNSSTDEKKVRQSLKEFPRDLNSLYLRVLHRLSRRKTWKQELARKMLTFLVASVQPLRLSEMSQALTVVTLPNSYQLPQKLSEPSLLEDLCSGLIVFDRSLPGYSEDPMLRFTHKSAHDFLLQSLESYESGHNELCIHTDVATRTRHETYLAMERRALIASFGKEMGVPPAVVRFFTTWRGANRELGLACLRYLSNPQYNKPGFGMGCLDSKDHAFLKYAAVFWHAHFSLSAPTSQDYIQVEAFMKSSAFWNCVAIQAAVAPHQYAVYHRHAGSLFPQHHWIRNH